MNLIEYYHDSGKMPDFIYYQLREASPQRNYEEQRKKILDKFVKQSQEKEQEEALQKELESKAEEALETALNDLLKGF